MKNHSPVMEIKVGLNFGSETLSVGRLAAQAGKIYFEYEKTFIERNLEISPLYLPLKTGLTCFDKNLFESLPGVFNDSLPDGWGRLLFDRFARSQSVLPADLTPIDRLAHVGNYGMGALVYEPDFRTSDANQTIILDELANQTQNILNGASEDVLQKLLILNGSSAGARPKALVGINSTKENIIYGTRILPDDYEPWIVKFANYFLHKKDQDILR